MSDAQNDQDTKLNGETNESELSVETNDPLESKKRFEDLGLPENILKGVFGMGFEKPSRIQSIALPSLLRGDHFVGQSQSGTGKTAAFSLSILAKIDESLQETQAICICPTRELAQQIESVIKKLAKFTKISIGLAVSGVENKAITSQVVVGTPGKMSDLAKRKDKDRRPLLNLKHLKILIIDEADEIIGSGSDNAKNTMWKQTESIKKAVPKDCQIGVFSATFPDNVMKLVHEFVPAPRTSLRLKTEELSLDKISQFYIECASEEEKYSNLVAMFRYLSAGSTIIFTATREAADSLKVKLNKDGHNVACIHGKMDTDERERIMQEFRDHKSRILISTNLIARGIDVQLVTLILNFDLPTKRDKTVDHETYLHRIGRSGRFGKAGIAINFVHDSVSKKNVEELKEYFGKPIREFKMEDIEDISDMLKSIT